MPSTYCAVRSRRVHSGTQGDNDGISKGQQRATEIFAKSDANTRVLAKTRDKILATTPSGPSSEEGGANPLIPLTHVNESM